MLWTAGGGLVRPPAFMPTHQHQHTNTQTHTLTHSRTRARARTHTPTYTHTHTHTHTHFGARIRTDARLHAHAHDAGLDAMLRSAMDRGVVLAGGSAGAICWYGVRIHGTQGTPRYITVKLLRELGKHEGGGLA